MSPYRVYEVDGAGRISKGHWIDADDDESALATARSRFPSVFELWQGGRLVARSDDGGSEA